MTRRLFRYFLLPALLAATLSARADSDLVKASLLESNVVYLRVATVDTNLSAEIDSARARLAADNLIGTILDLRFADGNDFGATDATAQLFAAKKLPLAILVNEETRGAAEKLAAALREAHDGLIFGSSTELTPDIVVKVKPAMEKKYLADPYTTVAAEETNSPSHTNDLFSFVDHVSEADLVRARIKDGEEAENFQPPKASSPPKPFLRDPVLARAMDLMKGLAVQREQQL
ncbi:MAG TPA: hypothetical protein VFV81_08105 [Verrucomicrobiae bacterium]|nr:hypothetical protein [Verrucomicrobiae bacterium]